MDPNQAYPPQGQAYPAYPPQGQAYPAYPPQGEAYPPQGVAYPPQGVAYPPQSVAYPPQSVAYPPQGQAYPPPSYDSKGGQPGYGYQPQTTATTNVAVVTAQPAAATTTYVSKPEQQNTGLAVCALVFSIITLVCFGCSCLYLTCIIPALILAIVALSGKGSSQKTNAGISIGLSATVVVCSSLFLIIFIPSYVITANSAISSVRYIPVTYDVTTALTTSRSCRSYYSSAYSTYCLRVSSSVCSTCMCTFYSSSGRYCPSRYY